MKFLRFYTNFNREVYPSSKVKIFRVSKGKEKLQPLPRHPKKEPLPLPTEDFGKLTNLAEVQQSEESAASVDASEYAENVVKVQMISQNLYKQIFGDTRARKLSVDAVTAKKYKDELQRHGIDIESTERVDDVKLKLPPLRGGNILSHFNEIAKEQIAPYEALLRGLLKNTPLPKRPEKWAYKVGWTEYDSKTGEARAVEYPSENALVLDVEVCMAAGAAPTLATAVGAERWYSWVSPQLLDDIADKSDSKSQHLTPAQLLPLGKNAPKIVVGHNVCYDRARIAEQYLIEDTGTRFLDTMSLHVCVSGITSYQRALLKSKQDPAPEDANWQAKSALNSLVEVHRLYCGGQTLSKEPRNIFVEGNLVDVRENFQLLMNYCANDVDSTHQVLRVLYPLFAERFPHPATLAGMLEIGAAYLPVNKNWLRYLKESDLAYEDLNIEAKYHLARRADEACALLEGEKYRQHLWLWDEDWSVQELKMKQSPQKKSLNKNNTPLNELPADEKRLYEKFQHLYDKQSLLPVRRPLLPGYPGWYRKLCKKPPKVSITDAEQTNDEGEIWSPGPTELSTGMQIAPKLLSLCWEGYPLHYIRDHGWGFLVPFRTDHPRPDDIQRIPVEQLVARCPVPEFARATATEQESDYAFGMLQQELQAKLGRREFFSKAKKDRTEGRYKGSGVWCGHVVEDCCYFLKLPHKNGSSLRVGNPLSRDFLNKFSENVLSSGDNESGIAARVIEIARMVSYWRNNRDRIMGQLVIWLPANLLPAALAASDGEYGAICPQVVACGTLTRRAMEPTWLTASNSQRERIGSELRAMVQSPPSYKIVGADVDSQELWIASVLGDAHAFGMHGTTPLGWMTLSGSKPKGTDMHSITAKAVGISRDHAKVINYARIYGAGQNFAEGLLKQFNPTFSSTEAKSKAMKMYAITKGKRVHRLREEFCDQFENRKYSSYEAMKIAGTCNRPIAEMFHDPKWEGGTESAMFNSLEQIAAGVKPVTPFLACRLSRALETGGEAALNDNRFLPTRINWVVQSGAVDFLHLMLVSMRWLMGPNIRFCLSFHDEVRYLVKEEMAYKTALAMHVTNLLTRSFCAARIGLMDLPMSVAFFSSVEVDTVLRKESTMDCKTPSNPNGLQSGYGIPPGKSLNIYEAIEKAGGNDLTKWEWIKK